MSAKTKRIGEILFFIAVMGLTFYAVLYKKDMNEMLSAVKGMQPICGVVAMLLGIAFVCQEGTMIWYLLASMHGTSSLMRCIEYSFIGFFYSGITPSATGGQPMQLYYMKKDGNRMSDSSVVLMTVALIYKFVLVLIGVALLVFWNQPLQQYLGNYFYLYLVGIGLNIILVVLIWGVMIYPTLIRRLIEGVCHLLVRLHIWKPSATRMEKIDGFIQGYQDAVHFLKDNPGKVAVVTLLTVIQRFTVFILTYVIYRGFGLHGAEAFTVVALQASVYIAVDMLPIPGAQGITELMYQAVFLQIFLGKFLVPSMLVCRAVNFYFLLLLSLVIVVINWGKGKVRKTIVS